MDFELNEEQKALIALGKDFVKREVDQKYLQELTKKGPKERIPWDLIKKLHDLGLLTLVIPEKYGGGGGDLLTRVVVAEALGQCGPVSGVCSSMATFWKVGSDLAALGSEEQQAEVFGMAMKDHHFYMGETATEPDHGNDPVLPHDAPGSGLSTYAYRDGDEYVINGEKCFTGAASASLLFVYLRTDKNKPISQAMSCILVPTSSPGFSVARFNELISSPMRPNGDLLFENVRVPARNLIGEENKGFPMYEGRRVFYLPRLGFEIGMAHWVYEYTKEFARTRVQGGKPIFEHLTVGTRIVDMLMHIEQAKYLVYKTAWECDQAAKAGNKLFNSLGFNLCNAVVHELSLLMAEHAAEVFSGRSALKELPIEGYIRSVYGGLHAYGTATINKVKSMNLI